MNAPKKRNAFLIPALLACVVVLLASLPYLVGIMITPHGAKFVGFTYNIDDACVYSSWIRQIANGSFFIRNQYTTEPQTALQFNLFFIVLGLISRFLHLSPAAVLHLSRIVLGFGLLFVIYKFAKRFLDDRMERLLIIPIVGLSSGLGWLMRGMQGHSGSVDLWQPEAITFLSLYLNPLFLIGMILMVASLHFLYRMKDTGSWRDAVLAGIMLLLLGNVHTYDVLTVGAVWSAYLVFDCIKTRSIKWRTVGLSIVSAVIAIPSVAYQVYLYTHVDVFRQRVESAAPSPAIWAYLLGYGLLLVLAIIGGWLSVKKKRDTALLYIWAIVGFAIPYIPVAQQRKLVMGLHIPISILAVITISSICKKAGPRLSTAIAVLATVALIPTNLLFMASDIRMLQENTTAPHYRPFIMDSEMQSLNWLRDNTKPCDTVLAFPDIALLTPAVAGNSVYYGHWSETPDYGTKLNEWMTFVSASTPDSWRKAFLIESKARYIVYFSHIEGVALPLPDGTVMQVTDLRSKPYLKVVFESGDTAIYRVSGV